jgi:hypothetical protein
MDGKLTEREWQKQVEDALTLFGWWFIHIPANVVVCPICHRKIYRGIAKGFPDILAIRPPRLLWLELKRERGQLEPEQRKVGDMLEACGQTWLHVRPRDRAALLKLLAPES